MVFDCRYDGTGVSDSLDDDTVVYDCLNDDTGVYSKYVRCLLIDFSNAFDSVDHLILIVKLKNLNITDNIMQWVVAFLTDRNKFVKVIENGDFPNN